VLLATAEQRLYDTARDLLRGVIELDDRPWRTEYLYSRAATIYGGTAEIQRNIIARRLSSNSERSNRGKRRLGTPYRCAAQDDAHGVRQRLDAALAELGWRDMLDEMPETAIPLVFGLLGETGAHAPVINDVVLREPGGAAPLPYAGGSWIVWERTDEPGTAVDDELPIRRVVTRRSRAFGRGPVGH